MIELTLASLISSSTAITTLCKTRIYPVYLPNEVTMPAIHYSFVGGSSKATQDTRGNQRYRFEVNCWGDTYADAVTLRQAVVIALDQYSQDGVFIQFLQNIDFDEHELLQYRALCEFYVYANQ